jgi:2-keto-4-pentenoate hydratase
MTLIHDALIPALLCARRSGVALPASAALGAMVPDVESACQIQHDTGVALGAWAPAELPRHWKSGAAKRNSPLSHAPLMPWGVRLGQGAQVVALDDMRFLTPGVESEIALRLARDVSPQQAAAMTHDHAGDWIDAMAVSIEVVDCRWVDQDLPPLLRTADFQMHGALVLGDWHPWQARAWAMQSCRLTVGDADPIERVGTHPLGDPVWLLPIWLRHLTRHGATVPAGTIVTTGTWTGLTPVQAGQQVRVQFEGIGEAALQL